MAKEVGNIAGTSGNQNSQEAQSRAEQDTFQIFEDLAANRETPLHVFRLFVSGTSARSALAIATVRKLCEDYLTDRYELEVIDVYQQPQIAGTADVVAIPTLIKELPVPVHRFVGDLTNTDKILRCLNLRGLG